MSSIATLILSLIGTIVMRFVGSEYGWLGTFISAFYPMVDLALAVAALTLAYAFGRGQWARPWLALLVFAAADALCSWLDITGIYVFAEGEGNILSLIANVLYLDAYAILALACHDQLLLLRHGPRHR